MKASQFFAPCVWTNPKSRLRLGVTFSLGVWSKFLRGERAGGSSEINQDRSLIKLADNERNYQRLRLRKTQTDAGRTKISLQLHCWESIQYHSNFGESHWLTMWYGSVFYTGALENIHQKILDRPMTGHKLDQTLKLVILSWRGGDTSETWWTYFWTYFYCPHNFLVWHFV